MSMKVIGHRTTKPVLHIWDNCPIFQRGNIYFVDCNFMSILLIILVVTLDTLCYVMDIEGLSPNNRIVVIWLA